jgi:tRNA threonylcarbamoyladenosine modification (KEOPS) complex  Pcc1 subunit
LVAIDADDPTALRAAKHTWCSLLIAAENTVDTIPE